MRLNGTTGISPTASSSGVPPRSTLRSGSGCNLAHPGYAATNLQFHSQRRPLDVISAFGNRIIAQAGPGIMDYRGAAKLVKRSDAAQTADLARRLWEVSEELTGVQFPLGVKAAA